MGKLDIKDDYSTVTGDMKLRMSLSLMADRYNEQIRERIYKTYNDPHIASIYRGIRKSGIYNKGGKSKVRKKILEFPDPYVFDFVDKVMESLYGRDWMADQRALGHELVKPWWVVDKI